MFRKQHTVLGRAPTTVVVAVLEIVDAQTRSNASTPHRVM